MKKLLFSLFILSFLISSCWWNKSIKGNGHITTEERTVEAFKNLHCSGSMQVHLTQGAQTPIKIETDENLLPYIEIRQRGGHITIGTKSGYSLRPSTEISIYVTAPLFEALTCSGSGNINTTAKVKNTEKLQLDVSGSGNIEMELDAPVVSGSISGSGDIRLKGETKDVNLSISGSGTAHCYDLKAENAEVQVSGAGDAEIFASVNINASASGSGNVNYKGGNPKINKSTSGSGSVNKAD